MYATYIFLFRTLCALAAWRCTAVTVDDIIREGVACNQMAVSIPGLQTLTGWFQVHLYHEALAIVTYSCLINMFIKYLLRMVSDTALWMSTHFYFQTYRLARVYGVRQALFRL